jgi:hypothetical protein
MRNAAPIGLNGDAQRFIALPFVTQWAADTMLANGV